MEKNERTYYQIGDLIIQVNSDLPYSVVDPIAEDFCIDERSPDFIFELCRVNSIPKVQGKHGKVYPFDYGYETVGENGEYLRAFLWKNGYHDTILKMNENVNTIYYLSPRVLAERFEE